jgi:hypothetical protein
LDTQTSASTGSINFDALWRSRVEQR